MSYGVLVTVLDRGTGWEVWSRVSAWVLVVVSDSGCGRKVSLGVPLKVSSGVLVAALDRRTCWEVLPRVSDGCRW